jgi:hypothetical protein
MLHILVVDMDMQPLDERERRVLERLASIAGGGGVVAAEQLHAHGFPDFVAEVYGSRAVFRESLENRKLQILQKKGYIRMGRGTYTVISK